MRSTRSRPSPPTPTPPSPAAPGSCSAQGGGLPDADRQKVIDELSPLLLTGGDPASGKPVFEQLCAKCHLHGGEGGKVGPDLTGMAAHPREELLIHIFDPSRSVEGNYTQYTVATADGRVLNGLLAAETRTSIELIDAEGKSQPLLREDVEELVASDKSLMPEGFEKQATPEQLAHLMAFLTRPGKYLPLDLRKVATVVSTRGMFYDENITVERLVFDDYSPKTVEGVPFLLVDPEGVSRTERHPPEQPQRRFAAADAAVRRASVQRRREVDPHAGRRRRLGLSRRPRRLALAAGAPALRRRRRPKTTRFRTASTWPTTSAASTYLSRNTPST